MKKQIKSESKFSFEIDQNALYLGVEDDDGKVQSLSYMDLTVLEYTPGRDYEADIVLFFNKGALHIEGENFEELYRHFENHQVSRIRRGICEDMSHPKIRKISFYTTNEILASEALSFSETRDN